MYLTLVSSCLALNVPLHYDEAGGEVCGEAKECCNDHSLVLKLR